MFEQDIAPQSGRLSAIDDQQDAGGRKLEALEPYANRMDGAVESMESAFPTLPIPYPPVANENNPTTADLPVMLVPRNIDLRRSFDRRYAKMMDEELGLLEQSTREASREVGELRVRKRSLGNKRDRHTRGTRKAVSREPAPPAPFYSVVADWVRRWVRFVRTFDPRALDVPERPLIEVVREVETSLDNTLARPVPETAGLAQKIDSVHAQWGNTLGSLEGQLAQFQQWLDGLGPLEPLPPAPSPEPAAPGVEEVD